MLLSTVGICFAASDYDSYTYPNTGYTMRYTIGSAKLSGKSAACATTAITSEEDDAYAFASLFSYKNGNCKNSGSTQTIAYAKLTISGNGGDTFKSVHALKDSDFDPMGKNKSLTLK